MQSIVQTLGTTSISKLQNQLLPCEMSNMTASGTMLLGSVSKIFRRDSVHRCSLHTRFMPRLEKTISGIGEQVRSVEFRRPMWCYGRWLNILSFFGHLSTLLGDLGVWPSLRNSAQNCIHHHESCTSHFHSRRTSDIQ